jgi:hypothetical protein
MRLIVPQQDLIAQIREYVYIYIPRYIYIYVYVCQAATAAHSCNSCNSELAPS